MFVKLTFFPGYPPFCFTRWFLCFLGGNSWYSRSAESIVVPHTMQSQLEVVRFETEILRSSLPGITVRFH